MSFTVAIIGRPNVGKSTLFNRLVGQRLAIVDDTPGVTRDRREGEARLGDLRFRIVDTAGLDDAGGAVLEARMQEQTERALAEADVALLLIDARVGVTPLDSHFADRFRRSATPVVLVANKCEGRGGEPGLLEAYALGLGEPVPVSAEHGEGMADLYDALVGFADAAASPGPAVDASDMDGNDMDGSEPRGDDAQAPATAGDEADPTLQLAVVGRPNVGKSTLLNRLLGEDRLLTGPEAGITRDAISVSWTWRGRPFRLVDTAGLRRRARVTGKLERLSGADTLRAIRFAHVVVVVVDATAGMDRQDLVIAGKVVEEGRAPVIAVNKWDLAADRGAVTARIADRLTASLPQARGIRTVPLSALTGKGVDRLLPAVAEAYDLWTVRIPTGPLNRWLADAVHGHAPPLVQGRRIKLRYITQAKARPPTFVVFVSRPEALPESYARYLVSELRSAFGLTGIPIRLLTRKGRNPYAP